MKTVEFATRLFYENNKHLDELLSKLNDENPIHRFAKDAWILIKMQNENNPGNGAGKGE